VQKRNKAFWNVNFRKIKYLGRLKKNKVWLFAIYTDDKPSAGDIQRWGGK
jgi:hypothetical protein